ncbi:hypothetical protein D3C78_1255030 [compost metagenome]
MQQAVKVTEFGFDHGGQLVVLVRQGGFQVERDHGGLWITGGFDVVVDLSQIGFGLAQQQHGCAVSGIGLRSGSADPATGTGDQDDPVLEQFRAGGVIKHKKPQQISKRAMATAVRSFAGNSDREDVSADSSTAPV